MSSWPRSTQADLEPLPSSYLALPDYHPAGRGGPSPLSAESIATWLELSVVVVVLIATLPPYSLTMFATPAILEVGDGESSSA